MKKLYLFLLTLLLIALPIHAQSFTATDSVTVSLITCEPGKALYSKFGHTALRVYDEENLDLIFNYGVFDFKAKWFYWKFIRGHTDYVLAVYPFKYFLGDYEMRNSAVWEQVLNLTSSEKQELINLLNINYLPENRMYRYNFVYDNCSTRPYKIINEALQRGVIIDIQSEALTARKMINQYISDTPWAKVGINLVFGADADKELALNMQTFLPEYLMDIMEETHLVKIENNHTKTPIVASLNKLVNPYPESKKTTNWLFHPTTLGLFFLLIGIILIILYKDMNHISHKIFDTVFYTIMGLGGIIIFFLMFFSEHPLTGKNINLLWINPLNLIMALFVWIKSARKCFFYYNTIYLLAIILSYITLYFFSQASVMEIIPFQALLLLRVLWREERLFHILSNPIKKD